MVPLVTWPTKPPTPVGVLPTGVFMESAVGLFTPPEETEHGTRPGGRGPGGVPGGVGSKNRRGHVRVYRGGSIPIAILSVCSVTF